jgi:hypothetical protein
MRIIFLPAGPAAANIDANLLPLGVLVEEYLRLAPHEEGRIRAELLVRRLAQVGADETVTVANAPNADYVRYANNHLFVVAPDTNFKLVPYNPPPATPHANPVEHAEVIAMAMRLAHSDAQKPSFFGMHPISLERKHLDELNPDEYFVSPKIDGVRVMLLTLYNRLWVLTRCMDVFPGQEIAGFDRMLFDCEYSPEANVYYVYDCICAPHAKYVGHLPLVERMREVEPLGEALSKLFRPQKFQPWGDMRELWDERGERSCKVDGLIFTPRTAPYRLGINYKLYKWKPAEFNTVDLQYRRGQLHCRGKGFTAMGTAVNPGRDGAIYECAPVDTGRYRLIKERPDKPHPNLDWIVYNVLQCAHENLQIEDLLNRQKAGPGPVPKRPSRKPGAAERSARTGAGAARSVPPTLLRQSVASLPADAPGPTAQTLAAQAAALLSSLGAPPPLK